MRWIFVQLFQDGETVQLRHDDIQEHDVRLMYADLLQSIFAVERDVTEGDLVCHLEVVAQDVAHGVVVVHDE